MQRSETHAVVRIASSRVRIWCVSRSLKMGDSSMKWCFVIAAVAGYFCSVSRIDAEAPLKPEEISIEQFNSGKVQIIGQLGYRLGTPLKIAGVWIPRYDPDGVTSKATPEPEFVVKSIDGKLPKRKVSFTSHDVQANPGVADLIRQGEASYTVFESVQYYGVPEAVWKTKGFIPIQPFRGWGMYNHITVVVVH